MSAGRLTAACALVVVAVAASGTASAHPVPDWRDDGHIDIADDGDGRDDGRDDGRIEIVESDPDPADLATDQVARPAPTRKRLATSLGWRMGMTTLVFDGERRAAVMFGLQGGVTLSRRWRGYAEYQWLMMSKGDPADDTREAARGYGHVLAGGVRLTLVDTTIRKLLRLYVDADGMAGLAATADSQLGGRLVPLVGGGVRFGYEMLRQRESPASSFDAHFLLRVTRTETGPGFLFGVGMEWGSR